MPYESERAANSEREGLARLAKVFKSCTLPVVYHGGGLLTWATLSAALEPFNHTREVVGFDTFTGYPAIGEADRTGRGYESLKPGVFASDSRAMLGELIALYDENRPLGHIPKVSLVAGDVCATLPAPLKDRPDTVLSAIVLSMNLYEPTVAALHLCWPLLATGGIVVAYSANEPYYPGVARALREIVPDAALRTFPFAPNLAFLVK